MPSRGGGAKTVVNAKLVGLLLSLAATVMVGCSTSTRTVASPYLVEKNLLFNPEWTGLPVFDVPRADWPATSSFATSGEVVEYRETIIDRQGRFARDHDALYRRFDSIRTGKIRR